jgi:hypothetical protein
MKRLEMLYFLKRCTCILYPFLKREIYKEIGESAASFQKRAQNWAAVIDARIGLKCKKM